MLTLSNKLLTAAILLLFLRINASAQVAGDDILKLVRNYGQAEVVIDYPGYDALSQLATTIFGVVMRRQDCGSFSFPAYCPCVCKDRDAV